MLPVSTMMFAPIADGLELVHVVLEVSLHRVVQALHKMQMLEGARCNIKGL